MMYDCPGCFVYTQKVIHTFQGDLHSVLVRSLSYPTVILFQAIYWLGHSEYQLFNLLTKRYSQDESTPKALDLVFENEITGTRSCVDKSHCIYMTFKKGFPCLYGYQLASHSSGDVSVGGFRLTKPPLGNASCFVTVLTRKSTLLGHHYFLLIVVSVFPACAVWLTQLECCCNFPFLAVQECQGHHFFWNVRY